LSFSQSDSAGHIAGLNAGPSPYRNRTSWKPGQSGNPLGGALLKRRNEQQRKRHAELLAAIGAEFPDPSGLERALIDQCADLFERSGRGGDNQKVRLARLAIQLLQQLREGRRERAAPKPVPSLAELGLE
jgi:hypothetical protein